MKKLLLFSLLVFSMYFSYGQNSSLSFDGVNDVCQILPNINLETDGNSTTVIVWIKIDSISSLHNYPIIWGNREAYLTLGGIYYAFGPILGGGIAVKYSDGNNTVLYFNSSNLLSCGEWHNLIITIPSNHQYPSIYIDSVLIITSKTQAYGIGDPTFITNNDDFAFGANWDTVSNLNSFDGKVFGLSVWNKELTNSEILYYSGCTPLGNENGLVAFWDFHETTGTSTLDLKNNIQAQLKGGVSWSIDVPQLNCETFIVNKNSRNEILIYPNPVGDILNLEFQTDEVSSSKVELHNLLGQVVLEKKFQIQQGKNNLTLEVNKIPKGIYILRIIGSEIFIKKIVKE